MYIHLYNCSCRRRYLCCHQCCCHKPGLIDVVLTPQTFLLIPVPVTATIETSYSWLHAGPERSKVQSIAGLGVHFGIENHKHLHHNYSRCYLKLVAAAAAAAAAVPPERCSLLALAFPREDDNLHIYSRQYRVEDKGSFLRCCELKDKV